MEKQKDYTELSRRMETYVQEKQMELQNIFDNWEDYGEHERQINSDRLVGEIRGMKCGLLFIQELNEEYWERNHMNIDCVVS